jgi:hypothetical protein
MALVYHVATIQYGGPIDVIAPGVAGLVLLGLAVLQFKGVLRPRSFWPKRLHGVSRVSGAVMLAAISAVFFSLAVSVVLE